MSLSEFLLARIEEDEALASDALAPPSMYPWGDRSLPQMAAADWPDAMRGYLGGAWGEHSARWNPTRVLAECAVKRELLDHYAHLMQPSEPDISPEYDDGYIDATDFAIKVLALVYVDHPDYREEWKP